MAGAKTLRAAVAVDGVGVGKNFHYPNANEVALL